GPPDPVRAAARVDPLPQFLARGPALVARLALDADDVGRKPVAVAAAAAASVVGIGIGRPLAGGERLPVIVTESAGDARRQSGGVHGAQRVVELPLEAPVHATDHVILERHAGSFRGLRILPGEVVVEELYDGLD